MYKISKIVYVIPAFYLHMGSIIDILKINPNFTLTIP